MKLDEDGSAGINIEELRYEPCRVAELLKGSIPLLTIRLSGVRCLSSIIALNYLLNQNNNRSSTVSKPSRLPIASPLSSHSNTPKPPLLLSILTSTAIKNLVLWAVQTIKVEIDNVELILQEKVSLTFSNINAF